MGKVSAKTKNDSLTTFKIPELFRKFPFAINMMTVKARDTHNFVSGLYNVFAGHAFSII